MSIAGPSEATTSGPRNAQKTRERILEAGRICFSRNSYENVGIRELAQMAGVTGALVNRYFGNKETLFVEVIQGAFRLDEHLPASLDELGHFLVSSIMAAGNPEEDGFNALRLLILATGSPGTSALVSERFHAEFVESLAQRLKGRNAQVRAATIASYVIGLATMRHLLLSPLLASPSANVAAKLAASSIQDCVIPPVT